MSITIVFVNKRVKPPRFWRSGVRIGGWDWAISLNPHPDSGPRVLPVHGQSRYFDRDYQLQT
jgi:hypothetical protein